MEKLDAKMKHTKAGAQRDAAAVKQSEAGSDSGRALRDARNDAERAVNAMRDIQLRYDQVQVGSPAWAQRLLLPSVEASVV
jgi:hypothetical protein